MKKAAEALRWQAEMFHGLSLSPKRAEELAALVSSLNESVLAFDDKTAFEDEPSGFTGALAALKSPGADR